MNFQDNIVKQGETTVYRTLFVCNVAKITVNFFAIASCKMILSSEKCFTFFPSEC